jgi:hypothetical protein
VRKTLGSILLASLAVAGCKKKIEERIDMTEYVLIYPGSPIVSLPKQTTKMSVKVRNVSEIKLTALRLSVKSEACTAKVTPEGIKELIPGERHEFTVDLTRVKGKPAQRYPLALTLRARGLPVPAGLDLMVDTGPPPERGWIDVGQVTLISKKQTRTAYYLLAGAPLLLLLGWLLWRWSRPKGEKQQTHDNRDED